MRRTAAISRCVATLRIRMLSDHSRRSEFVTQNRKRRFRSIIAFQVWLPWWEFLIMQPVCASITHRQGDLDELVTVVLTSGDDWRDASQPGLKPVEALDGPLNLHLNLHCQFTKVFQCLFSCRKRRSRRPAWLSSLRRSMERTRAGAAACWPVSRRAGATGPAGPRGG